jgi:hypothetical protein
METKYKIYHPDDEKDSVSNSIKVSLITILVLYKTVFQNSYAIMYAHVCSSFTLTSS